MEMEIQIGNAERSAESGGRGKGKLGFNQGFENLRI